MGEQIPGNYSRATSNRDRCAVTFRYSHASPDSTTSARRVLRHFSFLGKLSPTLHRTSTSLLLAQIARIGMIFQGRVCYVCVTRHRIAKFSLSFFRLGRLAQNRSRKRDYPLTTIVRFQFTYACACDQLCGTKTHRQNYDSCEILMLSYESGQSYKTADISYTSRKFKGTYSMCLL